MRRAAQVTDARCTHIQTFADACCQRDGKPWPPAPANPAPESGIDAATNAKAHVPRGRQKYPTLTHLPRVVELVPGHTRLPRDSEPIVGPNPFADEWHASVALCAHAPLDRPLPGPAALLQWVQHHRCEAPCRPLWSCVTCVTRVISLSLLALPPGC